MRKSRLILAFMFIALALRAGTYTSSFPATENPISEGGNWINGLATGLKWTNVQTTAGKVFGTQIGDTGNCTGLNDTHCADSTAVLTGSWGPDQTVQATVYTVGGTQIDFSEVELRLRTTITANSITGYEVNCSTSSTHYMQIVRWNGGLGDFTPLDSRAVTCANGDVIKATIVGTTITAFLNGAPQFSFVDSTFSSGAPGVGFFATNPTGDANYGFSSFTATDGLSNAFSTSFRGGIRASGNSVLR